jgi:hypothetical protein
MVDGNPMTPLNVTKANGEVHVEYTPASPWAETNHTVNLTFGDRTVAWSFTSGASRKTPTFFIEAEDFDNGGTSVAAASAMPYSGGAYAGLTAVAETDYSRGNEGASPLYRVNEDPQVPMDRTGDRDRGLVDIAVNYKLGWMGAPNWFNYTRTFPAGDYNVYAAVSHGDGVASATRIGGNLEDRTGGGNTLLGAFFGPSTGGWGNNALLPLMDAATTNNMVTLTLSGTKTLRFNSQNGDWDFMLFVPAGGAEPPKFSKVSKNANGTITVEWTGGGTLQAAPTVLGPWQDVTGATSPYTITPDQAMLYGRIRQ